VAQGFRQTFGIDYNEIFSPVVNYVLIRLFFLLLVVLLGWKDTHLDVKCAYLYGDLDCVNYLEIPKGYRNSSNANCAWKLTKALYGLHQSGRMWYIKLDQSLKKLGFSKVLGFNCVYSYGDFGLILVYVDDIVLFTRDLKSQSYCIDALKSCFDIVNLGPIQMLLGVEFIRKGASVFLSQLSYVEKLERKFEKYVCGYVHLPGNMGQVIRTPKKGDVLNTTFPYRSLIGSLLFLASRTRPDILFSVILLSQYNNEHTDFHVKLLLQVLNYVITTKHYRICLSKCKGNELTAYCDASYASDRDTRRSFSGYIVYVGGVPVSWHCTKQKSVTLSTMESEFVALVHCMKEVRWINRAHIYCPLVRDLEMKPIIFSDNVSSIHFSTNEVENERSKHVDVRYMFAREWYYRGYFSLKPISTAFNVSDIFTKWLSVQRLQTLCKGIFD
jgi:hypothetical protein